MTGADKNFPDFSRERALLHRLGSSARIAGIDEAGRGPWAGPVVAAAVILDPNNIPTGLDDSKKLSARRREALYPLIQASSSVGVGISDVDEIDRLNILAATMLAMQRAVADLPADLPANFALVDGNRAPPLPCPCETVIKGDAKCLSIAAASVIAKVTRDRIMTDLATSWPHYGWETNAGYGTKTHQAGLKNVGISPQHRRSFAPVRRVLESDPLDVVDQKTQDSTAKL